MSRGHLTIFRVGCYLAFVTAGLHFIGSTQGLQGANDSERQMLDLMQRLPLGLPGAPSHTMMDLFQGFSLLFTVLLGLTGGLGLMMARRAVSDPTLMRAVARTFAGTYLVMVIIGITNFFIVPTICMALVFVCFAVPATATS